MTTELIKKAGATTELATITRGDFLKRYSVGAVQRDCRKMQTAVECAASGTPVLSVMRKTYGEEWTSAYLATWIINVQEFFNIAAKMNDAQVEETTYMILDDFWALNIADINLVFGNAKRGQYGQLYGRIDGAIIYGWFQSYFEDRCNACENRTIREAEAMSSNNPVTNTRAEEFIKMLAEQKKVKP